MSVAGSNRSLPRTTATFLFTDVESHTELWEVDPDAMALALAGHETLIGDTVTAGGGRVVKNEGDALMAVFVDAVSAVDAARTAQLALIDASWPVVGTLRVRMGLHTGTAYERDGDYFGPAVIRAARLCGAAHGQQVVASAAVAVLAPAEWIDLGEHALRGLGAAERVHQLAGPGLPREFPPLRSVTPTQDRLPRPRTRSSVVSTSSSRRELRPPTCDAHRCRWQWQDAPGDRGRARRCRIRRTAPTSSICRWSPTRRRVSGGCGCARPADDGAPTNRPRLARASHAAARDVVIDNCEHLLDAVASTWSTT
jgi:class 3 adenylate cyclase